MTKNFIKYITCDVLIRKTQVLNFDLHRISMNTSLNTSSGGKTGIIIPACELYRYYKTSHALISESAAVLLPISFLKAVDSIQRLLSHLRRFKSPKFFKNSYSSIATVQIEDKDSPQWCESHFMLAGQSTRFSRIFVDLNFQSFSKTPLPPMPV